MAFEYLKALDLSPEVESKLRGLGARTPAALMSMIENSPEKFAAFIGGEESDRIRGKLPSLIPEEETAQLKNLPEFRGRFGAAMPPPATDAIRKAEARRDELLHDIQLLRASGDTSPEAQQLLRHLQEQLDQAIKTTVAGS